MNSLAERLRLQTWPAHKQVEATSFVRALLGGQVDRAGYCLLLASLHPIYAALETALTRQAQHPAISRVFSAELLRTAPLGSDLDLVAMPYYLNSRATTIYAGTNEVQRDLISRVLPAA